MFPSPLSDYQRQLLAQARQLVPSDPPAPWVRGPVLPAAGVTMGGWSQEEHVLLLSHDGYSLSDAQTGKRLTRERDATKADTLLSIPTLSFALPGEERPAQVFGLYGGDGVHLSPDGWTLGTVAPWWPTSYVLLWPAMGPGAGVHTFLDGATSIALHRLDYDELKCGFSPSGRRFLILGSAGAEIFWRRA